MILNNYTQSPSYSQKQSFRAKFNPGYAFSKSQCAVSGLSEAGKEIAQEFRRMFPKNKNHILYPNIVQIEAHKPTLMGFSLTDGKTDINGTFIFFGTKLRLDGLVEIYQALKEKLPIQRKIEKLTRKIGKADIKPRLEQRLLKEKKRLQEIMEVLQLYTIQTPLDHIP